MGESLALLITELIRSGRLIAQVVADGDTQSTEVQRILAELQSLYDDMQDRIQRITKDGHIDPREIDSIRNRQDKLLEQWHQVTNT